MSAWCTASSYCFMAKLMRFVVVLDLMNDTQATRRRYTQTLSRGDTWTYKPTDTQTHRHRDTQTHKDTHTHDYSDVLYVVAVFHYIFCTNKFSCKANRSPLTITFFPPINPTFIIYFGRNTVLKKQRSKQFQKQASPRPPANYI